MAKFYGAIGFAESTKSVSGVCTENITEHNYTGDVIKNTRNLQPGDNLNDDITISNVISIVADLFANSNFYAMRYINWMGASWKITKVEVQRPRLLLTIGGVYNGPKAATPNDS